VVGRVAPGWTVTLPAGVRRRCRSLLLPTAAREPRAWPAVLLPVACDCTAVSRWQVGAFVASVPFALPRRSYLLTTRLRVAACGVWCLAGRAVVGYAGLACAFSAVDLRTQSRESSPDARRTAAGGGCLSLTAPRGRGQRALAEATSGRHVSLPRCLDALGRAGSVSLARCLFGCRMHLLVRSAAWAVLQASRAARPISPRFSAAGLERRRGLPGAGVGSCSGPRVDRRRHAVRPPSVPEARLRR